LREDA
jgi:hypothetical protein